MTREEAYDLLKLLWSAALEAMYEGDINLDSQKIRYIRAQCLVMVAEEAIRHKVCRAYFCGYFAQECGMRWLVVGNAFAKGWSIWRTKG